MIYQIFYRKDNNQIDYVNGGCKSNNPDTTLYAERIIESATPITRDMKISGAGFAKSLNPVIPEKIVPADLLEAQNQFITAKTVEEKIAIIAKRIGLI